MNEILEKFKSYVRGKRVALLGFGISNRAAVDFLLSMGAILSVRDQNPVLDAADEARLSSLGVQMICGAHYLADITEDIVLKSPGIRYDVPELLAAAKKGSVITSEMEIFVSLCPATIFAVTGSDGKTTTTTVTAKMLETTGKRVYLGGNIGTPLLARVGEMTAEDYVVLELSSFQLHTMRFSPTVAIVTNVTPNHLNWHLSMEEYVESKKNIYLSQKNDARLVLNAENRITREMAKGAPSHVTLFSSKSKPENVPSCYYENETIYYDDGNGAEAIMTRADIKIVGMHNVENYMAAISAVMGYVSAEGMREVARTFGGVRHRIELVTEKAGVRYYNSSIDSSPTRSLAALASFDEPLIVIAGGYDKHIPLEPMIPTLAAKAKFIVLTGQTGVMLLSLLLEYGYPRGNIAYIGDFDAAVRYAASVAKEGDTVLLSPAAASFDAFKNFEARGDRFCELVRQL